MSKITQLNATAMKIKDIRLSSGLNQEDFGVRIGVTKSAVSTYEKGKSAPSLKTMRRIAAEFNISIESLLTSGGSQAAVEGSSVQSIGPIASQIYANLRFVPIPARATFAEMGDAPDPEQFDTIAVPIQPDDDLRIIDKCWVFEVNGDSMEETLHHGQRIVAEPISEGDWEYQSDGVYVVSYAGYLVVKRIKTNDLRRHNLLELWSDNEKKGGVKTAQRREIKAIWKVLRLDRAPRIY